MRVPPGVSTANFAAALGEWKATVGAEGVFTSDADLDLYRDAYSPFWCTALSDADAQAIADHLARPRK
jgi:hypothetical protein